MTWWFRKFLVYPYCKDVVREKKKDVVRSWLSRKHPIERKPRVCLSNLSLIPWKDQKFQIFNLEKVSLKRLCIWLIWWILSVISGEVKIEMKWSGRICGAAFGLTEWIPDTYMAYSQCSWGCHTIRNTACLSRRESLKFRGWKWRPRG